MPVGHWYFVEDIDLCRNERRRFASASTTRSARRRGVTAIDHAVLEPAASVTEERERVAVTTMSLTANQAIGAIGPV